MSLTPVASPTRPHAATLSAALRGLQQHERLDAPQPVQHPAVNPRIPLCTPVRLTSGVYGVVTAHNPNDSERYQVSWFSRHFWAVRRVWVDSSKFEVVNG